MVSHSTRARVDVSAPAGASSEPAADGGPGIRNFHATGSRWRFGEVVVSDIRLEPFQNDERSAARATYPGRPSVNVVFILEGSVQVTLDGSVFIFVAGSGVVLPTNEIPPFSCAETSRVLVVSVAGADSDELSGLVPNHPAAIAAAVIDAQPTLGFLRALVETARQHPIRTPPAGAIIAKLIASLLEADHDWHTRPNNPRVSEVFDLVEQRYSDPAFDSKAMARHLHTTPRDLELLLNREHGGRQSSDILLQRRLVAAMTLLHPGNTQPSDVIATRSGFSSVGHLDSAISGVYGLDTRMLLAIHPPA